METTRNPEYADKLIQEFCDFWNSSEYDLPKQFRIYPIPPSYYCPDCQIAGKWRRGQEFEHMMRCVRCDLVWTPLKVECLKTHLAEELVNVEGDGI